MAKTQIIHVAVEPAIKKMLDKAAKENGWSISTLIRWAILHQVGKP